MDYRIPQYIAMTMTEEHQRQEYGTVEVMILEYKVITTDTTVTV